MQNKNKLNNKKGIHLSGNDSYVKGDFDGHIYGEKKKRERTRNNIENRERRKHRFRHQFHHSHHAPPTSEPTKNYLNQQQHHPCNHKKIRIFIGSTKEGWSNSKKRKKRNYGLHNFSPLHLQTAPLMPPRCWKPPPSSTLPSAAPTVPAVNHARRRHHAPPRDWLYSRLHADVPAAVVDTAVSAINHARRRRCWPCQPRQSALP